MKRGFKIFAMMFMVAVAAVSCFGGGDDKVVSTALVGVVAGDETFDSYVVFENGQRGLITEGGNLVDQIPDSAYYPDKATGEARAWIYYTAEVVNDLIFDGTVDIQALYPVAIQEVEMSISDATAEIYKDDISVSNTNINYTRNRYVNLQMFYQSADASFDSEHKFKLVYNVNKTGVFAEYYPAVDNGLLYLELYHDAGSDVGGPNYTERVISFYLDDLMIGRHISSEYQGIKILYRSGGEVRAVEYKFAE